MPFPFTCPTCRHTSQVPDHLAGSQAKCPSCGFVVSIPATAVKSAPADDSIPVVGGDDIPVVSPIAPAAKKSSGAGIAVVILVCLAGFVALFCCGGGGILAYWILGGSTTTQTTDNYWQVAGPTTVATTRRADPPVVPPTLAPDEDRQPPSYWVQMLRDPDEQRVGRARERLTRMGIQAVPDLRKAARDHDLKLRLAAVSVLGEIGENAVDAWNDISVSLNEADAELRIAAAQALGKLGKGARPCLPQLLRATADPNPAVRAAASDSLQRIGAPSKEDAPKLLVLWQEPSPEKREIFVTAVRLLKPDTESTAILFVPLLTDPDKKIRLTAIEALGEAGAVVRAQSFAKLLPMLDSPDADIRQSALATLTKLGTPQPADRAELEKGLRGKSTEMRIYCVEALGGLGQDALPSVPLVARLLSDAESSVRLAAAKALGRFGKAAREVVEELLKARTDSDLAVRVEAIGVLGKLCRESGVLPALFNSLGDTDMEVSAAAAKAIRGAQPPLGKNDLPILVANLKSGKVEVRRLCALELARIGGDSESVLRDLLPALKDSDPAVRGNICAAIGALGPKAQDAIPVLTDMLNEILQNDGKGVGSVELFRQALTALGKIAKPADAAPIWNAGLKSKNKALRKEVLVVLSTAGEPARQVAPELCTLLGDKEVGELAGDIVSKLGGPDLIKELAKIVDNGPASARLVAIKMLGRMGPDAKPALGALYRAARYFNGKEAGQAAREAIRAIDKKK